jgi:phosphatidylethanolamine-binding protein (PEBP) family uncharacterized protein
MLEILMALCPDFVGVQPQQPDPETPHCQGKDISAPLRSGLPAGTKSVALIVDDRMPQIRPHRR